MRKSIKAALATILLGLVGLYLGASLHMEGYLGIIFAIATMGCFIIDAIEENQLFKKLHKEVNNEN